MLVVVISEDDHTQPSKFHYHAARQTTRGAAAKASGLNAEGGSCGKLIQAEYRRRQGCFLHYSMTSADEEEMGKSTRWVSRLKLKAAKLESLAVKARKVWNSVERFQITMTMKRNPLTLSRPPLLSGLLEGCRLGKLWRYFGITPLGRRSLEKGVVG